jgi:medium-chain acyl-[acyl-carrier-protein] hydrolase
MQKVWKEKIRIRYSDIDMNRRVTMPAIAYYLQEAATIHATHLGFASQQLASRNMAWVLFRIQIRMDSYPSYHENVNIETWPAMIKNPYDFRAFIITDEKGDRIGTAMTTWALIDIASRRPVRIPVDFEEAHDPGKELPFEPDMRKIGLVKSVDNETSFRVNFHDIDANIHTNNVSYLRWVIDSIPMTFLKTYRVRDVLLEFKAESFYDDTLVTQTEISDTGSELQCTHQMIRQSDQKIVAGARTVLIR